MVNIVQFPKTCCGQPVNWVTVYHRGYKSNVPRCRCDPDCDKLYEGRDANFDDEVFRCGDYPSCSSDCCCEDNEGGGGGCS